MKIALLSFEYPPETGFGGIGTYTWYHARALVKLGHQVHVLAGSTEPCELRTTEHDGVFVHRFRANDLVTKFADLFGKFRCYWTRQRLGNAWCMYLCLKQLMKIHTFDVIEMPECGAEGALINWLIPTPTVVRFHSPSRLIMEFYDVPGADIAMCSWIEQIAIDHATSLTSCSAFLADEVRHKMGVQRHIDVIANGIDLPLFDQEPIADLTERYGVPPGQVTILFAGRMERRKGIHLCAEIVETILSRHDVTFLFAGEDIFGYVEKVLKPALEGKHLLGSFHYLGKLNFKELRACARAVDIYLLPSLWENCPYSCLEAMASGRAIVCSDQGGMPELIQDGVTGLLAESEVPASYSAQLSRLIDSPELRQTLGDAARKSVEENLTDTRIARQTVDVYRRCIAKAPAP
jgi:glycosyltransferase involved in cell wall biosynthesis